MTQKIERGMILAAGYGRLAAARLAVAGGVALAAFGTAANDARALEVGQCGTPQQVAAHLRHEGHVFVARMNQLGANVETSRIDLSEVNITMNSARNWYKLVGNGQIGRSTQLCIAETGTNAQIYHPGFTEPSVTFARDVAKENCRLAQDNNCGHLADFLDRARDVSNSSPVFSGLFVTNDGTRGFWTLAANKLSDRFASYNTNAQTGATVPGIKGRNYTSGALVERARQRVVSSLENRLTP